MERSILILCLLTRRKRRERERYQLIDWSPDSKVLVADLLTWYYFGRLGTSHLVYRRKQGHSKEITGDLVLKGLHKDCGVEAG